MPGYRCQEVFPVTYNLSYSVYALQGATVTHGASGNDTLVGTPGNNIIDGHGEAYVYLPAAVGDGIA